MGGAGQALGPGLVQAPAPRMTAPWPSGYCLTLALSDSPIRSPWFSCRTSWMALRWIDTVQRARLPDDRFVPVASLHTGTCPCTPLSKWAPGSFEQALSPQGPRFFYQLPACFPLGSSPSNSGREREPACGVSLFAGVSPSLDRAPSVSISQGKRRRLGVTRRRLANLPSNRMDGLA